MLNSDKIRKFLESEFDLIGICPAVTPAGLSRFHQWLDAGYAGEMEYMVSRREAYSHPRHVLDGVRSIIMLGSLYAAPSANPRKSAEIADGRIARYARGSADYHDVIHGKLKRARNHFQAMCPAASFRGVVDTAPLLEREFAQLAGIGWQAKNTMLISPAKGSWFFLSAILTDLELEYDVPLQADYCGSCTACLDACPTGAFVGPGILDATRCISYWTIESRELPDKSIRQGIGNWLFGCDICQEVCPWNRKKSAYQETDRAEPPSLVGTRAGYSKAQLVEMLNLDEDSFRARFRHTPMWRAKRRGWIRNVLIVLGNSRDPELVPPISAMLKDQDPIVRSAAASALGQINDADSLLALKKALVSESDPNVIVEIRNSLHQNGDTAEKSWN